MVTTGALSVIVTLILSVPALLSLSVTDAVTVWVPADNVLTLTDPPVPASAPSRLEDQVIAEVRVVSSSSTSVADAVKLMLVPIA